MRYLKSVFKPVYFSLCFCALVCLVLSKPAHSSNIRIAVAANFQTTLKNLVNDYQNKYGGNFSISAASTGVLYAQISAGAPFDLFFAADEKTPTLLSEQLAETTNSAIDRFTYAQGLLTFWCLNNSPANIDELKAWRGNYAIANDKLAPYGKAAKQAIKNLNWPSERVVTGNNVAQVAQFILTENVDCGFVAKALLPANNKAKHSFDLPKHLYQPIIQQALRLPRSNSNKVKSSRVSHFINYIKTEAQALIIAQGYSPITASDVFNSDAEKTIQASQNLLLSYQQKTHFNQRKERLNGQAIEVSID